MTIEDWAKSGLAHLTGAAEGDPDFSRAPVLARAREVFSGFVTAVSRNEGRTPEARGLHQVDAAQLLSGRAGLNGHRRNGRISAGGATRLIAARDEWVALTLSREDDISLLPALLAADDLPEDPWIAVEAFVARRPAREFVDRARLLGLPASVLGEVEPAEPRVQFRGLSASPRSFKDLLVADLSALWAGPLCGQLLARAGATVVKVESPARPDGARRGNQDFLDWMNGLKLSYAVDFNHGADRLANLLRTADVVIEASRPQALARRGLGAGHLPPRRGQVWLRITSYGAEDPGAYWSGFGDDSAVAGGLVGHSPDGPVFCGDAIADPLTGIEAARLVVDALAEGGGRLIDVALAQVAAVYAALGTATPEPSKVPGTNDGSFKAMTAPPEFTSSILGETPALGASNDEVERLIERRRHPKPS